MGNTISLLLGSGFSVADGIPLISEVNKKIGEITENDIYIHSDMTASLVQKDSTINFRINKKDELFFVEFLKFYSTTILKNPSDFNYEILFDYLTAYSRFDKHFDEVHNFCEEFRNKYTSHLDFIDSDDNLIFHFKTYFSTIVSSYFQTARHYEDISLGNYPPYDNFISFLQQVIKSSNVRVHSLNHDLLFEHIASKASNLWQYFTDGYEELGSPYYGEVYTRQGINKSYRVRLKQFTNNFKNQLAYYKLHGSIDCYVADISSADQTRIKKDYGVSQIYQEHKDPNTNDYSYKSAFQHVYPDFLSGTTSKIVQYNIPYYQNLIEQFKSNLKESNILFVIGYGFKDEGINNILVSNFLADGKKMVVIDIIKPLSSLVTDFNVNVIEKPFIQVSYSEFMAEL
ncbi:MAG: SIR2 family protein [Chitinophagaceae bacterium]|nr:SIR2 family protein [Chitinophagaceae bacterium]